MGFLPIKKRGNAKLTEAQVRIIKQDLKDYHEGKSGDSPVEIGKALGLGTETIRRIDRGETWGWVSLDNEANLAAVLSAPATPEEQATMDKMAKEMFEWQEARKVSAVDKMAQSVKEVKRPDELVDDIGKE